MAYNLQILANDLIIIFNLNLPCYYSVDALVADTYEMFANGGIDDPANMADDRVYAFTGTKDTIVFPVAAEKIHEYYQSFVGDPAEDTQLNMASGQCRRRGFALGYHFQL